MTIFRAFLPTEPGRFQSLDGWRGISIIAVLACHLLPLGPSVWQLNEAAGYFGMAIFFSLSGFLITNFLLHHRSVVDFLIRRIFRIVPLAWLGLVAGLWLAHADRSKIVPNFLFFANLPPFWLTDVTSHYWSLCVEMQFYVGVAILFAMLGRRGLLLLPLAGIAITSLRVHAGMYGSIVTYYRIDEILSGATLALIYNGELGLIAKRALGKLNPWVLLVLFVVSTHPQGRFVDYLRPYLASALIGANLANGDTAMGKVLKSRLLAYIAAISFALYVVHHILAATWLATGTTLVKYAKRPLLLIATFLLAHISTFYYEHRWIDFGKRLSSRLEKRSSASL